MRHATIRLILAEASAHAHAGAGGVLDASDERTAVAYGVALSAIHQALEELEQPKAWARVALALADQRKSLPVDVLDAGLAQRAQRRAACLMELPEVNGFASIQEIHQLIGDTINIGAPRYNSGDVRGCAALYWTIIRLIVEVPAMRGLSGYARLQGQLRPLAESIPPGAPLAPVEADAWAWRLRHGLDLALTVHES